MYTDRLIQGSFLEIAQTLQDGRFRKMEIDVTAGHMYQFRVRSRNDLFGGEVSASPPIRVPCPSGNVESEDGGCSPCPVGMHSRALSLAESINGTFSMCVLCDINTVSAGGVSSCEACAAHTVANSGKSACVPCQSGHYRENDMAQCVLCPAGSFCTQYGMFVCPRGHFCPEVHCYPQPPHPTL